VQAFLSALTLVPLFILGRRWVGERATLAACALIAFYPPFVLYSILFMSETLFLLLVVSAVALIARPEASRGGHLLGGCVLAGAVLVRSAIKLLVPVTMVWLLLSPWWSRRERLVRTALLVLGLAVPLAAWTARNAAVHGEFIPTDCQTMYNIWQGNRPPGMNFYDVARAYYSYSKSPSVREALAQREAVEVILSAPLAWVARKTTEEVPQLLGWRHDTVVFFNVGRLGKPPPWVVSTITAFESALWIVIAGGGVVGLLLAAADPRRTLVLLLAATTVATSIVAFAMPRHRFPLVPFFALGAGLVLFREGPAWVPTRRRCVMAAAGLAALGVAVLCG
jgi:4-amino-4-deoxy-L-arabinose transferase-like glycosyltransferase